MILHQINPYFDFEAISTQIKNMNNHFDTSYDLGYGYENGTIERVENATKKAIELFENVSYHQTFPQYVRECINVGR